MGTRPRGSSDLLFRAHNRLAVVRLLQARSIFLRHRSPHHRVQVSQPEVLVSLRVPFCRFSLALSNLSLFARVAAVAQRYLLSDARTVEMSTPVEQQTLAPARGLFFRGEIFIVNLDFFSSILHAVRLSFSLDYNLHDVFLLIFL